MNVRITETQTGALSEMLTRYEAELTDARLQAQELRVVIDDLEERVAAVRKLLLTDDPRSSEVGSQHVEFESMPGDSLATAIHNVLASEDGPMSRQHLQARLQKLGKEADLPNISATLSYLKRQGLVTNPSRNKWTAPKAGS